MALAMARAMAMAFEGGGMWYQLPHEVFLLILSKLPVIYTVRLRTVCKGWNEILSSPDAFKTIYHNMPLVNTPLFFINLCENPNDEMQSWIIEPATGKLHNVTVPDYYNWGNLVVGACKSIYCRSSRGLDIPLSFTICNPGTNTFKILPRPLDLTYRWSFSAMAFDTSTTHFTLLIGQSEFIFDEEDDFFWENDVRNFLIEIYESEFNTWTQLYETMPLGMGFPVGRGVYSNGRFYWPHKCGTGDTIGFCIGERLWITIPGPKWAYVSDIEYLKRDSPSIFERINYFYDFVSWDGEVAFKISVEDNIIFSSYSWWLNGTEGRVVLLNTDVGCMWELRESTNEWCQVHIRLPNPLYGAAVNSSGWTLAAGEEKIVIYDGERRVVRTIDCSELHVDALPILDNWPLCEYVWAFEWNNVCWP